MARVPEILIVDQDPKARYEVKQLVKQAHLTVAGEAGLGTEAVSLASDAQPDVIICGHIDTVTTEGMTVYNVATGRGFDDACQILAAGHAGVRTGRSSPILLQPAPAVPTVAGVTPDVWSLAAT